jgi:hypothetical protein
VKVPVLVRLAVVAVAVALAAIGVVYLVVQCQHIPTPLPGREAGSTARRFGYAAVCFLLAAVVLGGGFFGGRHRSRSTTA